MKTEKISTASSTSLSTRSNSALASRIAALLAVALFPSMNLLTPSAHAQNPSPEAVHAFDHYIAAAESPSPQDLSTTKTFLSIDALPENDRTRQYSQLKQGHPIITHTPKCPATSCAPTPGALIHDWTGIIFVPTVTLAETLSALQEYDRDSDYYRPEVVQSKLLHKSGDRYTVYLRLRQKYAITVVLDTEYEIRYTRIDATHATSQSHSTRIAEIENLGSSKEHAHAPGDDHGFLSRLYTYWRFAQADNGVYIQCNAISLTRDIPPGLNWLVSPFTESIPRDSLRFTLTATRTALKKQFPQAQTTTY